MDMKKFVFWTGVYNVALGLSFFIPGYLPLIGFKTPDQLYYTINTGFFVVFIGVVLIYCSHDLKNRANLVYLNAMLRIVGFFLLAGFGVFGDLGGIAALAGVTDLVIGLIYIFGLKASENKSHLDFLLDRNPQS
jgi:hypothetical protein